MRPVEIPAEQRLEYNSMIEQVYRYANELDRKLPMYFLHAKEPPQHMQRLLTIVSRQVTCEYCPQLIPFQDCHYSTATDYVVFKQSSFCH